jgi:hypothetical protein
LQLRGAGAGAERNIFGSTTPSLRIVIVLEALHLILILKFLPGNDFSFKTPTKYHHIKKMYCNTLKTNSAQPKGSVLQMRW